MQNPSAWIRGQSFWPDPGIGERGNATSIEDVKRRHEAHLMGIPGVVGVGIGQTAGGRVIQVYVKEITKAVRVGVPSVLDGFATEIVRVGDVRRL